MTEGHLSRNNFVACSNCFSNKGLILDAQQIGNKNEIACPNCKSSSGTKLTPDLLGHLATRFFVHGTIHRCDYGAAPIVQFNKFQTTSISLSPDLDEDIKVLERILGIGFFYYGPKLWMVGEVEPLKKLIKKKTQTGILERIINEYPESMLTCENEFYRVRVSPEIPSEILEYDSPPTDKKRNGRLDSSSLPILYASTDLETCIHECRSMAEDDLFVATLAPTSSLRLLNLTEIIAEQNVTSFESLDMAIHMLFLAGRHSYRPARAIAEAAQIAGYDGLIYPSYFSLLRKGVIPFQTTFGLSLRTFPKLKEFQESLTVSNIALFGNPIRDNRLNVKCINKLIINKVQYDFSFGPVDP